MKAKSKTSGIKDIAQALGVSIGTVDRALHGRSDVSLKTKARVLQMAEQLGYRPNLAAQALKLNRRIEIAVVLPKHISHFFDPLREGIRTAADATVGLHVGVASLEYTRLGQGDSELMESLLKDKYDGIIFTPGNPGKLESIIQRLTAHGTAMLCVASDAPDSDRIGFVTAHAYTSGALAAELLGNKLSRKGHVATITGDLTTLDHADKLRGFAATLATLAPHLSLLPVVESHERPREAYRQTLALFRGSIKPQGLYVSTANSIPVLQALEEEKQLGKVQVVTTDLFQELVPFIETGKVLATLYQRPFTQGKVAFECLIKYLLEEKKSSPMVSLAPHIIFRSNLALFRNRLSDLAARSFG
jgi:LacI family transcriptional regulator